MSFNHLRVFLSSFNEIRSLWIKSFFPHSTFDVGRSMFDVHLRCKNNSALMPRPGNLPGLLNMSHFLCQTSQPHAHFLSDCIVGHQRPLSVADTFISLHITLRFETRVFIERLEIRQIID